MELNQGITKTFMKPNLICIYAGLACTMFSGCVTPTQIKNVTVAEPIALQKLDKKKSIMFRRIVVKVRRGDEIGTVYAGWLDVPQGKIYWRRGGHLNFSDEDFSQRFRDELEQANYEV
jgi:hypothetical protein